MLGASAVLLKSNKLLLIQEAAEKVYGKWNLPGGHVEPGEGITEAIIREVKEEIGLDVKIRSLLGIYTRCKSYVHSFRFVYYVDFNSLNIRLGEDIAGYKWFNINGLMKIKSKDLINPVVLRTIFMDILSGRSHSISVLKELTFK